MRFVGNQYVEDCIAVQRGVYGIPEEFSVLDKGDRIHVSIQTALAQNEFTTPVIRKSGNLISFDSSSVEAVLRGRYPIYSKLNDIFAVVTINGDFMKGTNSWSETTRVDFYTPENLLGGLDVNSPTKGLLSFVKPAYLDSTLCTGLAIGGKGICFPSPVPLGRAVLELVTPHISSKLDFYRARVRGTH